jgi:hypothetical protein
MTLEEIQALDSHAYQDQMRERVMAKMDPRPEVPEGDYDYWEWVRSSVTEAEMEAEFLLYKQELIDAENQRLKKVANQERIPELVQMREAFHTLHPDVPNPKVFFKELLEHPDVDYVAHVISEIEAKHLELQPTPEEIAKKQWIDDVEKELEIESITKDGLLEALVRKEFLGDTTLVDALKPKIEAINERKPRP